MNDPSINLVDQGHHHTMRFQGSRYRDTFHGIDQLRDQVCRRQRRFCKAVPQGRTNNPIVIRPDCW